MKIALLEQHFWTFVETDTPPPADSSDSAGQALRWLFPTDNSKTVDYRQDAVLSDTFNRLIELRSKISQLSDQEASMRHQIQQEMGLASVALFQNERVSWKQAKPSTPIDTTRLKAEHPELIAAYVQTSAGSRRFLVHAA